MAAVAAPGDHRSVLRDAVCPAARRSRWHAADLYPVRSRCRRRDGPRGDHQPGSVYLLVLGLGLGLFLQVMVLIAQNSAARRDLGAATASVNFARQIGSSIGVAL